MFEPNTISSCQTLSYVFCAKEVHTKKTRPQYTKINICQIFEYLQYLNSKYYGNLKQRMEK